MAAEANSSISKWIKYFREQKYKDLYRYLKSTTITRSKFNKQHSGCWDLQLFFMILYYMDKNKNKAFMDYMSNKKNTSMHYTNKKSNIIDNNRLKVSTFISSIYTSINEDNPNYLHKYIIRKQFNDDSFRYDITNIYDLDTLTNYQIYPMIIYTTLDRSFGNKYFIVHYFTIIKLGETYYNLSSWGSDTICVLPSIAPIEKEEFSRLSNLLSQFNLITDEERQECLILVKKHFLINAVVMYSNRNSEKKGSRVMPEEGIRLELNTFDKTRQYHIACINNYHEQINMMVSDKSRNNSRNNNK